MSWDNHSMYIKGVNREEMEGKKGVENVWYKDAMRAVNTCVRTGSDFMREQTIESLEDHDLYKSSNYPCVITEWFRG